MTVRFLVVAIAATAAACSAPATLPALHEAEQHEKDGKHELALEHYDRAVRACAAISNRRLRARDCAAAHLHRAELFVTMGDPTRAIAAYENIEVALPDDRTSAAEGLFRAGRLRLENGDDRGGYKQLWRCVTDYPDEQFAGDALATVVADGRKRNVEQLYSVLTELASAMAKTRVGDNVLFFLAELAANELDNPRAALGHYDQVVTAHEKSGLFDESLWRGAKLAIDLGDPAGATERLEKLLATREVAFGAGSYFSVWLDDAQLKVGRVYRDRLSDLAAAEAAFAKLPKDYPASILRDDALFELAVTRAQANKTPAACETLETLRRDWPDSKYELERAPALRQQLGCTQKPR